MLFKNILFASSGTAGSDNAAKLAFGLAEKQQAELTLYHCCGVPSRGVRHQRYRYPQRQPRAA